MKRTTFRLMVIIATAGLLAGCSKGFEPGTKEPPPPKPPAAKIPILPGGEPPVSSAHRISNPKLKHTMQTLNNDFMTIMTSMSDPSKLQTIAHAANDITTRVPHIKSASQEAQYQQLAEGMKSRAEAVASSASKGNSDATMKAAREMIEACESCHASYRPGGRLLGQ